MKFLTSITTLTLVLGACSVPDQVTVEGVVTAVDGDLTTVISFDIHTTDGDTIRLVPAPFGDFAFPLPHLGSHMRSLDPVRVTYTTADDGTNLAQAIDDA
ncbi:MAG: hypothetical protein ACRDX9_17620 [Acidimicrobiia bacterium]